MSNHEHGIIQIVEGRGTVDKLSDYEDESSRRAPTERFQKPVHGSIPTIIRSYKSAVVYRVNLMHGVSSAPVWQRNYYEHIVRNQRELELITKYIDYNPSNWQLDRDNLNNVRKLSTPENVDDYLKDAEETMGVKTL